MTTTDSSPHRIDEAERRLTEREHREAIRLCAVPLYAVGRPKGTRR
ncbi:hypothetical protein [Nocardia cyriacigeorgica]|nr:hypothetical protein [Nocardia cyriacigeorgica]